MIEKSNQNTIDFKESKIPATIRIGVTGHRKIDDICLIRECIKSELTNLQDSARKELPHSPHTIVVISPLAEGSDRLVAREVLDLKINDTTFVSGLETVFPMPEEIYVRDFTAPGSLEEFQDLKERADSIKALSYTGVRAEAFGNVGRYVADSCDILLVIWDGNTPEKQGGTFDIFEYAKKTECPYIWIHAKSGAIQRDDAGIKKFFEQLKPLDIFNNEKINPEEIMALANDRYVKFLGDAPKDALDVDAKRTFREKILPKYARASLLSKFYKTWYFRANLLIYSMAVLAVGTVTFQELFLPEHHEFIWFEVIYMIAILGTVYALNKIKLHRRWIDYRFITERIKSSIFFTLATIEYQPLGYLPQISKANRADYWIVDAFSWIWRIRPKIVPCKATDVDKLNEIKGYLKDKWINNELKYYRVQSKTQLKKYELYENVGNAVFGITLIIALMRALTISPFGEDNPTKSVLMGFVTILPAMGAAIAGLLANRDYHRVALRYDQMISPMENISVQFEKPMTLEDFIKLVEQADELLLRQNQDWRVSFLSQKLSPV